MKKHIPYTLSMLSLFGVIFLATSQLFAADYYVSTDGKNKNSGSKVSPWKTLTHAVKSLEPGDTVYVAPGEYPEVVRVTVSGEDGNWITLKSEESRKAKVNGFDLVADYIRIEGFEVSGWKKGIFAGDNIRVTAQKGCQIIDNFVHDIKGTGIVSGDHALVKGNLVKNVYKGIYASSHTLVEGNEVDTLIPDPLKKPKGKTKYNKANYMFFAGDHITFRNNYMHGTDEKYLLGKGAGGMGVCFFNSFDGWKYPSSNHILIEGNIGFNATHASEPTAGSRKDSKHITYRNNVFGNTVYVGIFPIHFQNVTIENNTLINCGAYPIWVSSPKMAKGAVIRNNLIAYTDDHAEYAQRNNNAAGELEGMKEIAQKKGWKLPDAGIRINEESWVSTMDIGNNLIWKTENRKYASTDLTADPMFVDAANKDFRLKAGSPAINAGAVLDHIKVDVDGNKRDAQPDIGAYEFVN